MLKITHEQSNESQRNKRKAQKYFKSIGALPNDGVKRVLHHKDITLRDNDVERYIQWNIDDLEVMTLSEHSSYHSQFRTYVQAWNKGKKTGPLSKEHKQKISNSLKGKNTGKRSEIVKQHMRENQPDRNGKNNPMYGKDMRMLMGDEKFNAMHKKQAAKIKGRIRVNNGIEERTVYPNEIPEGFVKGRLPKYR